MHAVRVLLFLITVLWPAIAISQQPPVYEYSLHLTPSECERGSAVLSLKGVSQNDSVSIDWSTGERNVHKVNNLEHGEYSVRIYVRHLDSTFHIRDTTLWFTIDTVKCPVGVPRHFSPNSDGYSDALNLTRVELYPNFEFHVYNRWGQRVHFQKNEYRPWDGTWLGMPLPDATYYYIFIYDSSRKDKLQKGDIAILR
jgi:gliding motility-associated-like protein